MRILQSLLICLIAFGLTAQANTQFSKIKIDLEDKDLGLLAKRGLEVDHGIYRPNKYLINVYSQAELEIIEAEGFEYYVMVPDMKKAYKKQLESCAAHGHDHQHSSPVVETRGLGCADTGPDPYAVFETPVNYGPSTMGGYFRLAEAYAEFDEMVALYPELVTAKEQIGDILTHGNNPVYWMKISDNVATDETDEPEVLYTAVHHAREPGGLSQLIFYMWYILENYDTDPEIKYLVDRTEMYFVPCMNPDGYLHNETTDPDGGGFWRKNRYPNAQGDSVGVDLNRNYGYFWGFDDSGSSPDETSQTYRGVGPFSEPETEAVRQFCNAHEFQIALNYHTFGNLLIHPWGFNDELTAEDDIFKAFANVMTADNDFFIGTGLETVGYLVNGDSDDWMYGEETEKNKIYALTPEVGPEFWANPDDVDFLNRTVQRMNLNTAHLTLNYGEVAEIDGEPFLYAPTGSLDFRYQRFGLQAASHNVTISSPNPGVTISNATNDYDLNMLEFEDFTIDYELDASVSDGDELEFIVTINNGFFDNNRTILKTYRSESAVVVSANNNSSFNEYNTNDEWGLTEDEFVSAPSSITDSPNGAYDDFANNIILFNTPLDLSDATGGNFKFWAKWDIEAQYDYVQFQISTDNINWEPMCGLYTDLGTENQDFNEPLWDGTVDWVQESIVLDDFAGEPTVWVRFVLISDTYVTGDGYYFDDVSVELFGDITSTFELSNEDFTILPNPSTGVFNLDFDAEISKGTLQYKLVNIIGQVVEEGAIRDIDDQLNLSAHESGVYFFKIYDGEKIVAKRKIVKSN